MYYYNYNYFKSWKINKSNHASRTSLSPTSFHSIFIRRIIEHIWFVQCFCHRIDMGLMNFAVVTKIGGLLMRTCWKGRRRSSLCIFYTHDFVMLYSSLAHSDICPRSKNRKWIAFMHFPSGKKLKGKTGAFAPLVRIVIHSYRDRNET